MVKKEFTREIQGYISTLKLYNRQLNTMHKKQIKILEQEDIELVQIQILQLEILSREKMKKEVVKYLIKYIEQENNNG